MNHLIYNPALATFGCIYNVMQSIAIINIAIMLVLVILFVCLAYT